MKQCMDFENLHRRLKKIIGQVQAIDRMVDEDIITERTRHLIRYAACKACALRSPSVTTLYLR